MMKWPAIRDVLLFVGGLGGVFHETVISATERPTLLILFAAMMGLPAFLRQDSKAGGIGEGTSRNSEKDSS